MTITAPITHTIAITPSIDGIPLTALSDQRLAALAEVDPAAPLSAPGRRFLGTCRGLLVEDLADQGGGGIRHARAVVADDVEGLVERALPSTPVSTWRTWVDLALWSSTDAEEGADLTTEATAALVEVGSTLLRALLDHLDEAVSSTWLEEALEGYLEALLVAVGQYDQDLSSFTEETLLEAREDLTEMALTAGGDLDGLAPYLVGENLARARQGLDSDLERLGQRGDRLHALGLSRGRLEVLDNDGALTLRTAR